MELNLGNANKGQFFTPYSVSQMMSEINIADIENQLTEKDFITMHEPCSGSGGIIIAYAESLKELGYNYQNQMYVEAIDIDELCFMMTYIQLSLYGIPARVILGDSLALNFQKAFYTPLYFINGFHWKLKSRYKQENKLATIKQAETITPTQLSLFSA